LTISVILSGCYAEELAVGHNAKKKGLRRYHPLFATVAQTGRVLDVLHRSGNVNDSHGTITFMRDCITAVCERLSGVTVESRKGAPFSAMKSWVFSETSWAPNRWKRRYRVLLLKHRVWTLNRKPIQLESFIPHEPGYEFKAVITNKQGSAKHILLFHNGRGIQENLFLEPKGQSQMDYVPMHRLAGNRLYFF
jgi:hypothetical protein